MSENDFHNQTMRVHWFCPTARSRERGNVYHNYRFTEEHVEVQIRNQQRGARRVRMDPRMQVIEYFCVHFGFNRLTQTGALPPEVLRELRLLDLVKGGIKRKQA